MNYKEEYKKVEKKIRQLLIEDGCPHENEWDIIVKVEDMSVYIGIPNEYRISQELRGRIQEMVPFQIQCAYETVGCERYYAYLVDVNGCPVPNPVMDYDRGWG